MVAQIRKLLHNTQTCRGLNLADGFVARLLVIAPGANFAGHRKGTNPVNDFVIAIHVAVQAVRFAVSNNVHARPFLVENGNVDSIVEQFREVIWSPGALGVQILTDVPPAGPPMGTYHRSGQDGQVAHWPLSFPT